MRLNLVALNKGETTHISRSSGTLPCLDLANYSPASLHLTRTLLDELFGSDHFPICLSLESATFQEECDPKLVVKEADWVLFSQLSEMEEMYVPPLVYGG